MNDFEHLNMLIDWSALNEYEQIVLHELLTKAFVVNMHEGDE